MSEKLKIEKLPWITAVISTTLSFVGVFWVSLLPTSLIPHFAFGDGCILSFISLPFILILFSFLGSKIFRNMVDSALLTSFYTIGLVSSIYADRNWPLLQPARAWISRYLSGEISTIVIPWFMAPPRSIAEQIIHGGLPVPWIDWLPSIIFWWFFAVVNGLFFLSINLIFRRQWVDIEKLPFPHTMLAYGFIDQAFRPKSGEKRLSAIFLLGLLAGFLFQFPLFMATIFPWFPDLYGWRDACWFGGKDLTSVFPAITVAIPGLSWFNIHPLAAALLYLVPLKTLFNIWFWFLVFVILMQIAWYGGYYTGIEGANACCRGFVYYNQLPYRWSAVAAGSIMGIFIIYMLTSRQYIVETVRAALRRLNLEVLDRVEKGEPVAYRVSYLILAITFVLMVAIWSVCGLSLAAALLIPITLFMSCIVCARFFGTVGAPAGISSGLFFKGLLYPGVAPWPPNREFGLGFYYTQFTWHWKGGGAPAVLSVASFKMSSLTEVENKSIFKSYVVAQVVAPLFSLIGFLVVLYTWGTTGTALGAYDMGVEPLIRYLDPARVAVFPYPEPWLIHWLTGVMFGGVLTYLHAKFVWFPFDPIGFTLGIEWSLFGSYWGMATIAWVAKTLTLRIGGSKAYEEYGLPIVSGFALGYVVALITGGTISVVRFFVPF